MLSNLPKVIRDGRTTSIHIGQIPKSQVAFYYSHFPLCDHIYETYSINTGHPVHYVVMHVSEILIATNKPA